MVVRIALLQRKGGVGKTTCTVNIGRALADLTGKTVRLLDFDEQRSLSRWAERGGGWLLDSTVQMPENVDDPIAWGADALKSTDTADYVLLDTAPSFDDLATLALIEADVFVLPVQPSGLDLEAADDMLRVIDGGIPNRERPAPRVALVPSRTKSGASLSARIQDALNERGHLVLAPIRDRVANSEAALVGQPTADYKPKDLAAAEWSALTKQLLRVL